MYYFLCPENKKKIKLKGLTLRHHISSFSSTRTNKRHKLKYGTFKIYKYNCCRYVTTLQYGWFKCYCVLNNVTRIVCSVLQLEYSGWESVLNRFYHGFIFFHDYFLSLFEDDRGDMDRKWEGGVACNKSRWPDSNLGRCYVVTYVYHQADKGKKFMWNSRLCTNIQVSTLSVVAAIVLQKTIIKTSLSFFSSSSS